MKTANYKTLKEVVLSYMDEAQYTTAAYRRLKAIAIRGLDELNHDVKGNIKSCRICVEANKTAELPSDYIKWRKIGLLNREGEVATLKHNTDLTNYAELDPGRLSKNTDNMGGGFDMSFRTELFYLNFYDAGYGFFGSYNLYGIPGNQLTDVGDFKVDEKNGIVLLDNNFPADYIIMEYLASPEYDDGYYIHIQDREFLISWIAWRDVIQEAASRKVSIYDKTQRRKEYYNQKRLAQLRANPFTVQEMYDTSASNIRLVPKG